MVSRTVQAGMTPTAVASASALLVLALAVAPAHAQDADPSWGFAAGAEFVSGEYGGDESVDEWYVPLTTWVDVGRVSFRVTVPYLSVDAPSGTIIVGPGGQPIIGDGPRTTESGLGDIIAAVTVRDVLTAMEGDLALDLTGKVKLGTADEDKGLGSGETDYTVQADLLRFFPQFTAVASVGYVFRGDPDDYDLDDGMLAMLGGTWFIGNARSLGLFMEYREASFLDNDDRLEATGYFGWPIREGWRGSVYLITGLSDSSPDFGGGVSIRTAF
jgi:hypothetical protein